MAMSENTVETEKKLANHSKMQIVVFRLGQEEYALQIDQIKEVVKTPAITPMPQSPKYIKGVSNIRGNIIAIVDLEERFSLEQHATEQSGTKGEYTLVVESDEVKMGVLVRDVPNTLAIADSAIDRSMIGVDDQGYVKGIVKIDKRLIILIDIFKVMSQRETSATLQKSAAVLA
jgi:purine-binding chemotaxis protein CheW